jgi:hypothetical protein
MDRRSLLKSAGALLVPSTAATALATTVNPQLERALNGYLDAFRAYYGKPYQPDDDSEDAHDRADRDVERRRDAFDDARKELSRVVMARYDLAREDDCPGLSALSVDVGDITVVVAADIDSSNDSEPFGREIPALVPRTAAARARLDALPAFNPREYASEEDEERLSVKCYRPVMPVADLSRMPESEPIPLTAEITRAFGPDDSVNITRTWSPDGAYTCHKCNLCIFTGRTLEELAAKKERECRVTVPLNRVDDVLYLPAPELPDDGLVEEPGVISDSYWDHTDSEWLSIKTNIRRERTVVMTQKAWDRLPLSKDPAWTHEPCGHNKTVVAFQTEEGPVPKALMATAIGSESTA